MIAILVVITLVAVAVAGALAAYVLRLTREERDRSEARATSLAEALGAPGAPAAVAPGSLAADTAETPAADPTAARANERLFGSVLPSSAPPTFLLIPLIGVLVVGLALGGVYVWNRPSVEASAVSQQTTPPLELMALRHARHGDALVISGLVRNPEGGQAITGLTAIAFVFDRQGSFLTSGRTELDFPRLAPGDESPFSITIPDGTAVGRYRISFRNDAGILPHLDRRNESLDAVPRVGTR